MHFQKIVKLKLKEKDIYGNKHFKRGKTSSTLVNIGETEEHGTKIFFKPDPEIFEEIKFDYETCLKD